MAAVQERNAIRGRKEEAKAQKNDAISGAVDVPETLNIRCSVLSRGGKTDPGGRSAKVSRAGQGKTDVEWFPMSIRDLDSQSHACYSAGAELESSHPGFNDSEYRRDFARVPAACPIRVS